jgi:glyoxylase-like metal-dependent hydrolase (beta-lactamase superfamily II)
MLEIKCFTFGPFQTNTYVVRNEQQILLIDPACSNEYERQQLEQYINQLSIVNCQLSIVNYQLSIIATHGHLDHLWGAKWATSKWNTPVLIHEADIPMARAMQQQYNMFGIRATAEDFPIESLSAEGGPTAQRSYSETVLQRSGLSILSTPGHTPGSLCLYWPEDKVLISGDTLFQMGYGRTDLPGGNMGQLITSLERLFALPADTVVYPGHGDFTTIGAERR